jgi:hypothetical protein
MSLVPYGEEYVLIPARLSPGEAQDHRVRLLGLIGENPQPIIEFTEADGCLHPSSISLQLCLATAAQVQDSGIPPRFGPVAERLLSAQKLL